MAGMNLKELTRGIQGTLRLSPEAFLPLAMVKRGSSINMMTPSSSQQPSTGPVAGKAELDLCRRFSLLLAELPSSLSFRVHNLSVSTQHSFTSSLANVYQR